VTAVPDVYADLIAEGESLDQLVASLDPQQWALPTPAPGWTVAHQVAHLASIVKLAELAATDPAAFQALTAGAASDFEGAVETALTPYLALPPGALIERWRTERAAATAALAAVPPGQMVPWLARPLPPTVLASAGIMELFAHGQDIADGVGVRREYTDRIIHLAGFAVRTWDFGYLVRGLTPPAQEFRFELTAPSGALWEFGPAGAADTVTGPAVDFCLLVTRRRHRDDLAVTATGAEADRWLNIAQAYRGSPGQGRSPGQFAKANAAVGS
jgi:enediyne biosynthesis protein E11